MYLCYRSQKKFGARLCFSHLSVILSTWEGVNPSMQWDRHPPGQTPHPGKHPPPSDTTGYSEQAGGTHPTGMHTCLDKYIDYIDNHRKKAKMYFLTSSKLYGFPILRMVCWLLIHLKRHCFRK